MLQDLIDIYIKAGIAASKEGKSFLANKMLSAAIEETKNDSQKQIKLAIVLYNNAEACASEGNYREANSLLRRVMQIYLHESLNPAPILDKLAELALAQNKPRQSLQFYKRAKLADEKFGLTKENRALSRLKTMALICVKVNRLKEAADLYSGSTALQFPPKEI